ncbi:MAG: T9SS type A sorting domain-containing protein, partial [Bacteroidota bacterium]
VDEPEEEMRATSGGAYVSGGPSGAQDPGTSEEYYNYMQGLWGDGSPRYEFGDGFYRSEFTDRTTRFHYAGDPVTESFYSEVNTDGNGAVSPQGQRSVFISTGPFRLAPGESTTLLFAFPFGQGMTNLHSVAVMRRNAETLKALQASGFFVGSRVEGTQAEPTFELALSRARPNPSRQPEALLTLPESTPVRATVYDAVGRHLAVLLTGEVAEGETVLQMPGGLTPGTYLLRIEVPGAEETLTFTVLR